MTPSTAITTPRIQLRISALFAGLAMSTVIFVVLIGPGGTGHHLTVLLLLLPFFGIPHGALDYALARTLFEPRCGRYWAPGFVILYLAVMAFVLTVWYIQPTFSLAVFLALTYYHFSTGDALTSPRNPLILRLSEWVARGGVILCFPALFDRTAVQRLLSYLAPETGVVFLLDIMAALAPVCGFATALAIMASLVSFVRHRAAIDLARAAELGVLALLFVALPALLAFTLHFNFLHSLRHMLGSTIQSHGRSAVRIWARILSLSLPVTLATLLLGAGAYGLLSGLSFDTSRLMQVVFIGIASMTYPHIVVVSLAAHTDRSARLPAASAPVQAARTRSSALDPAS